MRPPNYEVRNVPVTTSLPRFGCEPQLRPPKRFEKSSENSQSMLQKSCQRSHELAMRPLQEVNRYRHPSGGDSSKNNSFQPKMYVNPDLKSPIINKMFVDY